jgi:hypothetical protein
MLCSINWPHDIIIGLRALLSTSDNAVDLYFRYGKYWLVKRVSQHVKSKVEI